MLHDTSSLAQWCLLIGLANLVALHASDVRLLLWVLVCTITADLSCALNELARLNWPIFIGGVPPQRLPQHTRTCQRNAKSGTVRSPRSDNRVYGLTHVRRNRFEPDRTVGHDGLVRPRTLSRDSLFLPCTPAQRHRDHQVQHATNIGTLREIVLPIAGATHKTWLSCRSNRDTALAALEAHRILPKGVIIATRRFDSSASSQIRMSGLRVIHLDTA